MSTQVYARLAVLACGLALGLLVAALALLAAAPDGPLPGGFPARREQAISLVGLLGPPVLGAVIAGRRPANPYGWIWSAYALGWAAVGFNEAYATYVAAAGPGALAWARPVAWVGNFAFVPLIALTALILLLFPDGRAPSGRWRVLVPVIAVVGALTSVATILFMDGTNTPVGNPLAVGGAAGRVFGVVNDVGLTSLFLAVLAGAVSLVVRFRRATGGERRQLEWLAAGGAFLAAVIAADLLGLEAPGLLDVVLETLSFGALYVGVGVAVLRYRLYDIDRLVNRTLVYGALTVLLALVYAALVLGGGQAVGGVGGQTPTWLVAAATLTAAALFGPARRRIQAVVDRRFNRRRYDAIRTIDAFSVRLREQVELDTISAELVGVADRTMEPTKVSLWLR